MAVNLLQNLWTSQTATKTQTKVVILRHRSKAREGPLFLQTVTEKMLQRRLSSRRSLEPRIGLIESHTSQGQRTREETRSYL